MSEGPSSQAHVPWRQSLATRLGLTSVLIVVAALVAVGVGLVWIALQAQRASVFQSLEKSGDKVALLISSYVRGAVDDLQLFEGIESLSTLPPAQKKAALENLLIQRQSLFSQLAVLDKNGVEEVKVSRFYTFLPGDLGSRANEDAFVNAVGGQTYLSTVYVSRDSGLLSVQAALPINARGGQVVGVLTGEANVSRLWQEVSQIQVGQTGYAYLVDVNGRFVAYQVPAEVLQRYGEDMRRMPPVAEFMANAPEDLRQVHEYAGLTGERVIGLYVPIQGTTWAVIIELPTQEAYASVNQMQWYLVGLTLLGMMVAGGVSFTVSQRFTRPLGALTVSAQRIGSGDLGAEVVEVRRQDEVGVLAHAFRQMQGELKALYEGLEQKVAERTAELAQRGDDLEKLNQTLQTTTQQAERRAALLSASSQVARAAIQVRDLDQLLPQVTQLISQAFGYYHVGIFIVDEIGRFAILRAANSEGGQRMLARSHKLAVGKEGIVGYVTGTGQPRIALDVGADAVHFDNPDLPQTRSEMALPLRVRDPRHEMGGQVFGALDAQSTQEAAFAEEDVAVLSTLADQIAIAIENARLFTQAQAAVQEAEGAHRRYLRQEWEQLLTVLQPASHEYHVSGVPPVGDAPLPEIDQAIQQGRPVTVVGDGSFPAKAALAMPIKLRDQLIGVIDLHETEAERQWTDEDVALVTAVADQVALALENARLFEQTRQRAQHEQLVSQISARMRAAPDIESVLRTTVHEVRRALGASRGVVRLGVEKQLPAASSEVDTR